MYESFLFICVSVFGLFVTGISEQSCAPRCDFTGMYRGQCVLERVIDIYTGSLLMYTCMCVCACV